MAGGERLEAVFNGEFVDRVPFALKGWRIPHGEEEQCLLRQGMCILDSAPVYGAGCLPGCLWLKIYGWARPVPPSACAGGGPSDRC